MSRVTATNAYSHEENIVRGKYCNVNRTLRITRHNSWSHDNLLTKYWWVVERIRWNRCNTKKSTPSISGDKTALVAPRSHQWATRRSSRLNGKGSSTLTSYDFRTLSIGPAQESNSRPTAVFRTTRQAYLLVLYGNFNILKYWEKLN